MVVQSGTGIEEIGRDELFFFTSVQGTDSIAHYSPDTFVAGCGQCSGVASRQFNQAALGPLKVMGGKHISATSA